MERIQPQVGSSLEAEGGEQEEAEGVARTTEPGYPAPAPGPGHDPYHNGYALDGGLASHATAHLVASR